MTKKWTKAEEKYLWASRDRRTASELAKKFKVNAGQIKRKLLELSKKLKPVAKKAPLRSKKVKSKSRKEKPNKRRKAIVTEAERYDLAVGLFDRGVEFFNSKKFEKAQRVFQEIVEKFSEEKEFIDRARLYLNLIQRQLKPSEPRPRNFEDYYNQAIYQLNLGDYDKALKYLKKASEKKPKDPSITYFMALVFAGKEDPKTAVAYLRDAIQLDVENRVLARNETEFQPYLDDPELRELLFPRKMVGDRIESA